MALRVLNIPPGCAPFRKRLIAEIVAQSAGNDHSDVLWLMPTRHLLDARREEFHRAAGRCYIPPVLNTLRQFVFSLHELHGSAVVLPSELRPGIIADIGQCSPGLATLVAVFISEMKQSHPQAGAREIASVLEDTFARADVSEAVYLRVSRALEMFSSYESTLQRAGFVDFEDILSQSPHMISGMRTPRMVILDGFYELTRAEEALLHTLIETAGDALCLIPVSSPEDKLQYCYSHGLKERFGADSEFIAPEAPLPVLTYVQTPSKEEELQYIARTIKERFLSSQQRDLEKITVVFPSLQGYRELAERVFARYGVPLSTRHDAPMARAMDDLYHLVLCLADDFPRLSTARFLSSSAFGRINPELRRTVPSLCLTTGVLKGESAWKRAFQSAGLRDAADVLFRHLGGLRKALREGTHAAFCESLVSVLEAMGFAPLMEDHERFRAALRPLEQLDALALQHVTAHSKLDAMKVCLDTLATGADTHGVRLAELLEVRGHEPHELYFGGLKDGELPTRPEVDFLLPDSIRRALGLIDTGRFLHLQEFVFRRLINSAAGLFMSYPSSEDDKFYLPSAFLSDAVEIPLPSSSALYSPQELDQRKAPAQEPQPREIAHVFKYGKDRALSVTEVEAFRRCPRRFFIERVAGLEPRALEDYEIEAREMGTIIHRVMELLMKHPVADLTSFTQRAEEALAEVLADTPLDAYFSALIRDTLLALIPDIHTIEQKIQEEGYVVHRLEEKVQEELEGIAVKGKADRIDRNDSGHVQVIDYKTGTANISCADIMNRGKALQLPLYGAMLRARSMQTARFGIFSLKDGKLKWVPNARDIKAGNNADVIIDAALAWLRDTAEQLHKGAFPALPADDGVCRGCHESPFCPYIHGGLRSRDER